MAIEILEGGLKESNPTDPSFAEKTAKVIGRTGVRAGEAALGYPGDIASLLTDLGSYITKGITPTYSEAQQQLAKSIPIEEDADFQFMTPRLPFTSEQVKENITEEQTGNYFKPTNQAEKRYDDFVQDITQLILPGGALPFNKAFKVAGLGNAAAEIAHQLGAKDQGEAIAKFSGMLLGNLWGGRKHLKELTTKNYETASQLAEKAVIKVPNLKEQTNEVLKKLSRGSREVPWKDKLFKLTDDIQSKIFLGEAKVPELIELKQDLNDILRTTHFPGRAKKYISELRDGLKSAITDYGVENKEFGKAWKTAEGLYSGLNADNVLESFIKRNPTIQKIAKSPLAKFMALGGSYAMGLPKVAGELALYGGVNYGLDQLKLLSTSPAAFKEYTKMVGSALKDDIKTYRNSARKLDKIVARQDKVNKKSAPSNGGFEIIEGGLKS
jgi:hypothetical protein